MIDEVRTYEPRAAGDKDVVHINELLSHKKAQKSTKAKKGKWLPAEQLDFFLCLLCLFVAYVFSIFTLSRKSIDASPSVRPMLIQPRVATGFQLPGQTVC